MKASLYTVLILALGITSCAIYQKTSVVPPLEIPGAKHVKMRMCAPCHRERVESFESTTHARIAVKGMEKEGLGCGMCHGPGSLHMENEYEPNLIINPRKNPDICFRCHLDKKAEFRLQYHHPVLEGRVACADCHDSHGSESRSWTMREGCTICHKVHGSVNDKLLIARDSNLCLRCHFQTQLDSSRFLVGDSNHTTRMPRGSCFSAACHTTVHGSNFDDHLRY